jgi:hypothetical protein
MLIVLGILLATGPTPALAQQSPSGQADKTAEDLSASSFLALRDKREEITKQIDEAEKALRDLQSAEYWLIQEQDAKATLERKEKSGRLTPVERATLQKKMDDARSSAGTESSLEKAQASIKQRQGELEELRKKRDNVDAEMSRRIDLETPKQKFKTTMSITFALLVGLVIIGFFLVAFYDETVRRDIFSGMSGIQFVTLFSLVIAIILFGITGILEGKELAALLGGLSGYILGRGSVGAGTPTPTPQPTP